MSRLSAPEADASIQPTNVPREERAPRKTSMGMMDWLNRFRRDTGANVILLFGLFALPTIGIVGAGLEYGRFNILRGRLDTAADAAAIAAIATARDFITQNAGSQSGSALTDAAIAAGKAQAAKAFAANAGSVTRLFAVTPSIDLTRNGQGIGGQVKYSATYPSVFGKLFGYSTWPFSGKATSTLTLTTYINYHIIVDTSQSMGIGSTPADMQALFDRVVKYNNGSSGEPGCVFACHVKASGQTYTNEDLARNYSPKITLRINAAASAVQTIVNQALASQGSSGQNTIKFALYAMQQDPATGVTLRTLAAPENAPFSKVAAAASVLELGNNTQDGTGDSNFSASIGAFSNSLAPQGDGSTADLALNYVFIITDGVQDVPGGCYTGHCVTALDPAICTPLKAKANVGVLYTTYNPIYKDNMTSKDYEASYNALVFPIASMIAPNLQACATQPTSQYYFEATDGPAITTGMQKLFAPTSQLARLRP
jgi:putative Flp pilus-assembly TadE/G-like protein